MKKIIETEEKEGLVSLLGERVTLLCMNYFYTGKLVGVNETCVVLENPAIVYETGSWDKEGWSDVQNLPSQVLYVQTTAIEAFGVLK